MAVYRWWRSVQLTHLTNSREDVTRAKLVCNQRNVFHAVYESAKKIHFVKWNAGWVYTITLRPYPLCSLFQPSDCHGAHKAVGLLGGATALPLPQMTLHEV